MAAAQDGPHDRDVTVLTTGVVGDVENGPLRVLSPEKDTEMQVVKAGAEHGSATVDKHTNPPMRSSV